jgi:hypothetical protein
MAVLPAALHASWQQVAISFVPGKLVVRATVFPVSAVEEMVALATLPVPHQILPVVTV